MKLTTATGPPVLPACTQHTQADLKRHRYRPPASPSQRHTCNADKPTSKGTELGHGPACPASPYAPQTSRHQKTLTTATGPLVPPACTQHIQAQPYARHAHEHQVAVDETRDRTMDGASVTQPIGQTTKRTVGLRFRAHGVGFRNRGLGVGFRVEGLGFWVWVFGFEVRGLGFGV